MAIDVWCRGLMDCFVFIPGLLHGFVVVASAVNCECGGYECECVSSSILRVSNYFNLFNIVCTLLGVFSSESVLVVSNYSKIFHIENDFLLINILK